MEELIMQEILNSGIFAIITVGLLLYTLKANKNREEEFFKVLEHQGYLLREQGEKLSSIATVLTNLVTRIEKLEDKIHKQ